jgi:hypothetical protein
MRRTARWIGFAAFAAFLAMAAGCAVNTSFTYKPNPPAAEARKLPVKLAVLPFTDGTENFTKRGSALSDGQYNLAKAGMFKSMDALTPEFWGKAFADDLAASGSFRSARFVFAPSEIRDEGYSVDGTLKKVNFAATFDYANEILVSFRGTRISDGKVVWEKEIDKAWKTPMSVNTDCGMAIQCRIDGMHADWNKWIAAVFSEAREDLEKKLASASGSGAGGAAAGHVAGPPAPESVDGTIDRILKGK